VRRPILRPIKVRVDAGMLVLGQVEVSDNSDPLGRREENVLSGRIALGECLGRSWMGVSAARIAREIASQLGDAELYQDILDAWLEYHSNAALVRDIRKALS